MNEEERQRYEYERAHRAAQTAETWQVIDEAGTAHEVAVDEGRGSAPSWWAATPDVARRSHTSPRDAVVLVAQACRWDIAEVLAPGQVAKADVREQGEAAARRAYAARDEVVAALDEARTLLDGVRAALGPTCVDATHEALPGLVREVVLCDGATHERCDEQRDEVAHLKASCAALLAAWESSEEAIALVLQAQSSAEPETLAREIGVRLGYPLLADVAMLAATAPTARAEGAREMREAAVKHATERAAELDASVTEEEAADDEGGYGRFCEALMFAESLAALPLPRGAQ